MFFYEVFLNRPNWYGFKDCVMLTKVQSVSVQYICFYHLRFITDFSYFGIKEKLRRKPHEIIDKSLTFGDPHNCYWGRFEHCEIAF